MGLEKLTGEHGPNWRDIATVLILVVMGLGTFLASQVWNDVQDLHSQLDKLSSSQAVEAAALKPTMDAVVRLVDSTHEQVGTLDTRLTSDEQHWQSSEQDLSQRVADDQLRLNRDEADWHAAKAISEAQRHHLSPETEP